MKGISLHSVVPVRTEAREGAEQSTQILFGETFEIMNTDRCTDRIQSTYLNTGRWRYVRLDGDGQEGWVDAKMVTPMTESEYQAYKKTYQEAAMVAFPMAYAVSENNGQTIPLTAGTKLTQYSVISNQPSEVARVGRFEVLGVGFRIDPSMVIEKPLELNEQNLQQVVRFFLNTPYLWGGKNALGMDCSGFTQVVMSLFGKRLPRNASEQATCGRAIRDIQNARAGDLVFFDHEDGKISHVGIILQSPITNHQLPLTVVHCSGRVKVERLDEKGIFSTEIKNAECPNGTYTHHLVSIRRI
ncbi:MAG: C40 family peptidase [Paludibacteraceae bacterium]|nr:C40 family peptidase [Paludibacteraceae bacterium]